MGISIPISFKIDQMYPTPIGVFVLTIELGLRLGIDFYAQVREYQLVQTGYNFSCAVIVYVDFYYSPVILAVHVKVRGTIVRLELLPYI